MPNLAILVSNVQPENGNLRVAYIAWVEGNPEPEGGDVATNWAENVTQTNARVETDAKAKWIAKGVIFGGADKTQIFAGRTN